MWKKRVFLVVRECLYIFISLIHSLPVAIIAMETALSKNSESYAHPISPITFIFGIQSQIVPLAIPAGSLILRSADKIF